MLLYRDMQKAHLLWPWLYILKISRLSIFGKEQPLKSYRMNWNHLKQHSLPFLTTTELMWKADSTYIRNSPITTGLSTRKDSVTGNLGNNSGLLVKYIIAVRLQGKSIISGYYLQWSVGLRALKTCEQSMDMYILLSVQLVLPCICLKTMVNGFDVFRKQLLLPLASVCEPCFQPL